ncbi:MAG: DNA-processing protein DprA [Alistipes sp.]|nr:DNA-processing protein DprA [Alistipes sp.]
MEFNENEYSGPIELLNRELVAFFASRTSTDEARTLALKWAAEVCQTEKIVISGFNSPLEREVLDFLLAHNRSVIVALGRGLYRKIPTYLQTAYDRGRVLFLSFRNNQRQSQSTAQIRNWLIASLAPEIIFAPFNNSSMLSAMHYTYKTYNTQNKSVKILGE